MSNMNIKVDPALEETEGTKSTNNIPSVSDMADSWNLYWEGNSDKITTQGAKVTLDIADNFVDSSMGFVTEVVFSDYAGLQGSFSMIHTIIGTAAILIMLILAASKGLKTMINNAAGADYIPPMEIIKDVIKSCALAVALPWILVAVMELLPKIGKLLYLDGIIAQLFSTSVWDKFISGSATEFIEATETIKMYFNPSWWMFSIVMMFCIWLGNMCFVLKMCKFQVEIMLLDSLALIAAIDNTSTRKEFYENWVASLKSIVIIFLANIAFYSLMYRCYTSLMNSGTNVICMDSILAIGAALCLIRGTIFTNKYKGGGFMGSAFSGVTNAARSVTAMMPRM